MAQIETELQLLKVEVVNMWTLVHSQLTNARIAFLNFDKDLARAVVQKEKRVNGSELKIDRDCENIFCPVLSGCHRSAFSAGGIKDQFESGADWRYC